MTRRHLLIAIAIVSVLLGHELLMSAAAHAVESPDHPMAMMNMPALDAETPTVTDNHAICFDVIAASPSRPAHSFPHLALALPSTIGIDREPPQLGRVDPPTHPPDVRRALLQVYRN